MEPASFEQSNITMQPPEGISCDDVHPIAAFVGETTSGHYVTVTCWKITKDELEELQRNGGRIWLKVLGILPPVTLGTANPWS